MSGLRLLHPGGEYELVDGRIFLAALDPDTHGVVFRQVSGDAEYVLRDSESGGQFCTALVERRWQMNGSHEVAVLVPSDFTLDDLAEMRPA